MSRVIDTKQEGYRVDGPDIMHIMLLCYVHHIDGVDSRTVCPVPACANAIAQSCLF